MKYGCKRYIAAVTAVIDGDFQVNCLRRRGVSNMFGYPTEGDEDLVPREKIEAKVIPQVKAGTSRLQKF